MSNPMTTPQDDNKSTAAEITVHNTYSYPPQPYHFNFAVEQQTPRNVFDGMPEFVGAIPYTHDPHGSVTYALIHLAIVTKNHDNLKRLLREFRHRGDAPSMWMVIRLGCQFGDVETLSYIIGYSHYNTFYNPNFDIINIGEMRVCCRYNVFRESILAMLAKYADSDKIYIEYFNPGTTDEPDDEEQEICICFVTRDNELIDVFKRWDFDDDGRDSDCD